MVSDARLFEFCESDRVVLQIPHGDHPDDPGKRSNGGLRYEEG